MRGYGAGQSGPLTGWAPSVTVFKVPLSLPIGQTRRLEAPTRPVCGLLVSVKQGTLDIWLGDQQGGAVNPLPDFHYIITGRPEWTPLPYAEYVFTAGSTGILALLATILIVG